MDLGLTTTVIEGKMQY